MPEHSFWAIKGFVKNYFGAFAKIKTTKIFQTTVLKDLLGLVKQVNNDPEGTIVGYLKNNQSLVYDSM